MATGQKSTNPLFGLMPTSKSGIVEAGVNALQSLGLLRPKTSDISYMTADPNKPTILGSKEAQNLKKSYEQVQKQKTQYATKELPKRANNAAKQVNKFYDDLANNPDYADRADEIKQVKQQVLKQVNDQALIKQQTALTDTDPNKINQFGIKKAQADIKKATEQPLTKQDKAISTRGNAFIRTGEGLLGGVNKFAQDVSLAAQALGNPVQQAVENIPFIKNTQQAYINDINKKLDNANISADERINLLKQKSFLEANSKTANKVLRSGELPTALEQIQNTQLGEDVAKGYRNTGLYKTGEFVGKEVLPLVAAPETGLGTQAAKMVAKTGIGKALTKYGGGKATELFVKGAVENAIQEQPIGAIQEAARVATGEQTALEALGNQVKRTALAGSLGGVADLGLGAAGRVFDDKIGAPLARARKFKDLQQQRAAVQGERIARDADIEEVQNALLDLNQRKAAEDFAPSFKDKIAEKTQKQTVKEVNAVIQETEKTIKQTAKEEQAVQSALAKLEKKNVKAEDLQYKQEAALGKQAVKGVNEVINDVESKFTREELQARKAEIIARKEQINNLKTEIKDVQAGLKQNLPDAKYSLANLEDLTSKLDGLQKAETERLALSQAKRINSQADEAAKLSRQSSPETGQILNSSQSDDAFNELIDPVQNLPSNERITNIKPQDFSIKAQTSEAVLPSEARFQAGADRPALAQRLEEKTALSSEIGDIDNLAQKAQSPEPTKSLDDPDINAPIKNKTLEPRGLKASEKELIQRPASAGETKTNKLFDTIDKNPNISPELKAKIKEKGNTTYQVRNTKELFDRAASRVETENVDELAKEIRLKSRSEGKWTDEEVATGYELARKFEAEGRLDEAAELEEALAKKATEGGQMIQAYAKYGKTTPEGAIREANKILENAMPLAKAKQLREATNNLIKDFNKANKKAVEDILNFCPPGSFE